MTQADKIVNWVVFGKPTEKMPPLIEKMPEVPYPKGFEPKKGKSK